MVIILLHRCILIVSFHLLKTDFLFLHKVDHLIQLEAINGISVYAVNKEFQETYEEKVMMFAPDELEIFKRNENE